MAVLCGCGDESPTSPSTRTFATTTAIPETAQLVVVSGSTYRPIEAATVTVGGKGYETDGGGRVTLPEIPRLGSNIEIAAPDFLNRRTLFRSPNDLGFTQSSGEHLFTLWPRTSPDGLHENFTRELVYLWEGELYPLYRPDPRFQGATIIVDGVLKRDDRAMQVIRHAAATMTEVTDNPYVLGAEAANGNLPIRLVYDPHHPQFREPGYGNVRAFCDNEFAWGNIITSSTVVFRAIEYARTSTTLHELGHTLGLSHTTSERDLMCPYYHTGKLEDFTPRERLVIQLMLQRRPGNEFPDNDRQASTRWGSRSHGGSGHLIIVCGGDS